MKVGICGLGVVGGALRALLETKDGLKIVGYDPAIPGHQDKNALLDCRMVFICVPAPTMEVGGQDLSLVRECLEYVHPDSVAYIRTTSLPGTADKLSRVSGKRVVAFPEFLTERTAKEDVLTQPMICGTSSDCQDQRLFQERISSKVIFGKNSEAEMAKYIHNVFCAVKVNFFNHVNDLCERTKVDYEASVNLANFPTGFVGSRHTQVPGPDGKFGYGGKCFPKDVAALAYLAEQHQARLLASALRMMQAENTLFRTRRIDE